MIMRKYLQYILAICLLFCACDDREIVESGAADDNAVTMSFYAGIESYPDSLQTRTVLGGIVSDNTRKVLWLPDDDIYVTNGTTGAKFTNIKTETTSIAEFEGSISPGDNYFAVFPYSMVTGYSSSQFQINLPSVQQYVKDGIAAESFPMVAQCADNQFNFKNVCGILVLNLTGEDVIDSIRFSGIDAGDKAMKVAGVGTIQANYGVYPVMNMLSAAKDYVTLSCTDYSGKGVTLNKTTPTAFHIVLPVATYSSFELQLFSSGKPIKPIKSDKTLTIRRSERTTTSSLEYVAFEPEAVDLGLSVKWATCNIGATTPEEYGKYYSWAEISDKNKYDWSTYKWWLNWSTSKIITKYNNGFEYGSHGTIDNRTTIELEDDAAHVNWGGGWRIPTKSEMEELINGCVWIWTSIEGVSGYSIEGPNNNSIFIPTGGRYDEKNLLDENTIGYYWSSTLFIKGHPDYAYFLSISNDKKKIDYSDRTYGHLIRPILPYDSTDVTAISLNYDSLHIYVKDTISLSTTVYVGNSIIQLPVIWKSDNEKIAKVNNGLITPIGEGVCIISAICGNVSASCMVSVFDFQPQYVDLGLSVNWATCNVGAFVPEGYGKYYAWGETNSKDVYDWSTYKYCNGTYNSLTKYCYVSSFGEYGANGFIDDKITLDLEDDVANVEWGDEWHIPSRSEFNELFSNCSWTKTSRNGISGCLVTSNISGFTNQSIFLPAAGYKYSSSLVQAGNTLLYSINGLDTALPPNGCGCFHQYVESNYSCDGGRQIGLSVRPVRPSNNWANYITITLETESVELMLGHTLQLIPTVKHNNDVVVYEAVEFISDNPSVVTVSKTGLVKGINTGTAIITASISGKSATCTVTVKPEGHEYVDLGLSVLWGTCNIGAASPEGYGDFFAWGETNTKSNYSWSTYKYCNGSSSTMTKYCTDSSYGTVDNKTVLDLTDDAARANWGGSWRMPTKNEMNELCNTELCSHQWTTVNGAVGYKIISKVPGYEGHFIFFPAAGYWNNSKWAADRFAGQYWSSSLTSGGPTMACKLDFNSTNVGIDVNAASRYSGFPIRPVRPIDVMNITMNRQSLELSEGATDTLKAMVLPARTITLGVSWSSSNTDVATVDQKGIVTAISVGTCVITATCQDYSATCSVSVKPFIPQYVDLGLSVKWATCNVGATKPEEYGAYFAWGETEAKDVYSWETYKYCNGSYNTLTKYNSSTESGTIDNKYDLELSDDAAYVNWGTKWFTPAKGHFTELVNNCTWTWYPSGNNEFNGIAGYKVKSKITGYTDNYIFLPANGYYGNIIAFKNSNGYYLTKSISNRSAEGYIFDFGNGGYGIAESDRCCGYAVRPICL